MFKSPEITSLPPAAQLLFSSFCGDFHGGSLLVFLKVVNRQVQMVVLLRAERVALLEFPEVRVNDGEWHHLLVEITSSKEGKDTKYLAQVSLDYDMFKVRDGLEMLFTPRRNTLCIVFLKKINNYRATCSFRQKSR